MITIICAVAQNRAIGYRNKLLFHLGADLKRFKALTTGHTIIMGRKTFESLPKGALPNRRNIVLTHNAAYHAEGAEVFTSLDQALAHTTIKEDIFIIGGASVYAEAFAKADRLCLTEVMASPKEADVFFPSYDAAEWKESFREHHDADEKNDVAFDFADYTRNA